MFQRLRSHQRRQYACPYNAANISDENVLTLVGNSIERVHNQTNNHDEEAIHG